MKKSKKIVHLELQILNETHKFAKNFFTSTIEKIDIRKELLNIYIPVFVYYNGQIHYIEKPNEKDTEITMFDKIMRESNNEKQLGYLYNDLYNYYKVSPQSKLVSYEEFLVDYIHSLKPNEKETH